MISRSAGDLQKAVMTFPTVWDGLLDDRKIKEQV
jgi:hypothetical protein